jgi:hypothetical protein
MHCFALSKSRKADELRDSRYYQSVTLEFKGYIAAKKTMHTKLNESRLQLFVDQVVFQVIMLKHFTTKYLNGSRRSHKKQSS